MERTAQGLMDTRQTTKGCNIGVSCHSTSSYAGRNMPLPSRDMTPCMRLDPQVNGVKCSKDANGESE